MTINVTLLPTPHLTIVRAANQVVISWPVTSPTLGLECATSLTQTNWTVLTNAVIVNEQFWLTNDLAAPAGFFRLR